MSPRFVYQLLLTSLLVCLVVVGLFALHQLVYAPGTNASFKEGSEVAPELPWERMSFQFVGSALFK